MEDTVNKRKNNLNLKPKKMSKKVVVILIILLLIIVLISSAFIYFLVKNNRIYNNILTLENGQTYEINSKIDRVFFTNKIVNLVKEKSINVKINYKKDSVTISPDIFSKRFRVSLDKNLEVGIYDNYAFKIKYNYFSDMAVFVPNELSSYGIVDIYLEKDDGSLEKYILKKEIENGVINIKNPNLSDISNYVLTYIEVKDISVKEVEDGVVYIGKEKSKRLNVEVFPENATDKEYIITSDNNEIAEVTQNKEVLGKNLGDTSINIKSSNFSKKFNVHIANYVTSIIMNANTINLYTGSKFNLEVSTKPENVENPDIHMWIENEEIACLENGSVVKGLKVGSTKLIAITLKGDDVRLEVPINVSEYVASSPKNYNLTYINGILIANKTYALPRDYAPGGLTGETMAAFNKMKQAASAEGLNFWISSGYRSYETQRGLYNNYVAHYGQASADTFSARPGNSEHQTGLAMDVNYIEDWFGDTTEGKWLADNCHKYGFIVRYPKNKEAITGYKYEPWHIRYLGVDIATDVYNSGLCLEEYLNITSKYPE